MKAPLCMSSERESTTFPGSLLQEEEKGGWEGVRLATPPGRVVFAPHSYITFRSEGDSGSLQSGSQGLN